MQPLNWLEMHPTGESKDRSDQDYVAELIKAKSLFSVSHTNSQIGKAKAQAMSKFHLKKQN